MVRKVAPLLHVRHVHGENMKKKFWAMPLVLIAAVCVALLSACGGPSVEELIREDLTTEFDAVNPQDEDLLASMEASSEGSFEQLGIDIQDFAEAYLGDFTYEIGDIVVDEEAGTADATVTVSMKSMSAILEEFTTQFEEWIATVDLSTMSSDEELYLKAGEILLDVTAATESTESDVVITYSKDSEGTWVADEDAAAAILEAME